MKALLAFTLLLFISTSSFAQEESETSPILFIYDASGSMWAAMEGKTRVEIARDVLSTSINQLPDAQKIGLIAYGHRKKGDCVDVEYLVGLSNTDKSKVTGEIQQIKPLGMTPLAYSANLAIEDLKKSNQKATIILVTDGIESCDGNICEVIQHAKDAGVDFKLHIIGFGLKDEETAQLKCAAAAGEGQYFDAKDSAGLLGSLAEATSATVDMPVGNYGISVKLNGQMIDAIIQVLEPGTKNKVSLKRTYRDTVLITLPEGKHDLIITALENTDLQPIQISGVSADPSEIVYQEISFDGGKMAWTITNNGKPWDTLIRIFEAGTKKQVAAGRSYGEEEEFELNPGLYDVELLAFVISGEKSIRKEKIEIKAGEKLELTHDYKTGIAKIGASHSSDLLDATVVIKIASTKENVSGMRTYTSESSNPREFILTPGEYEVTVTAVPKEHAGKKEVFIMKILAGDTFEKTIKF
ncbi:vWA domain-containing protein [Algoriphagus chordae]|uniref:Ca-activated chloride channel family protein n=1 Tax=Algoriphagus chordae TaxID=237019 RepID=A0A2W7R6S4_9BACT|nr:VWA domain-containing protein [Algoriphagus chordae]PZX55841.1 Ca-activated chloride channel family protein [Algoriphagus chordae]